MAFEIEHKYLVKNNDYKKMAISSHKIKQGYLSRNPDCVVRIRILDDEAAYLTVKGRNFSRIPGDPRNDIRHEFEYKVPLTDAIEMLDLCEGEIIEKIRYKVPYEGYIWEVDEFHGINEGLIVAEIELKTSVSNYPLPSFIGKEVTGEPKYYNSNL